MCNRTSFDSNLKTDFQQWLSEIKNHTWNLDYPNNFYYDYNNNIIIYKKESMNPGMWLAQKKEYIRLKFNENWILTNVLENDFDQDKLQEVIMDIVSVWKNANSPEVKMKKIAQEITDKTNAKKNELLWKIDSVNKVYKTKLDSMDYELRKIIKKSQKPKY